MADTLLQRLDFVGLGEGVEARLAPIADSVAHHLDLALQGLALQVAGAPSAARFLFGRERIEADGGGPAAHWHVLAAGQLDAKFAEAATRAGHRQARIGVDPRWHAGSHAIIAQSLIRGVIRDGVEAAMRTRRRPLGLFGGGDPAAILEVTEVVADGLATLVGAMVLDLDLTFSGYAERLRMDADAALAGERNRLKKVVAEAGRVLEQAAQGQRDAGEDTVADPELVPLRAGAERLADRMVELVEDLTVSGRATKALAAEVLRCARLLGEDSGVKAGQAEALLDGLAALVPATTAMAHQSAVLVRNARSGARRHGKVRGEIAAARQALEAARQNGGDLAEAVERADALGLAANLLAARLANGGAGPASDGALDKDMRALALGLSQLAGELRTGQDRTRLAWRQAEAGLDTALALMVRSSMEQGETLRALSAQERESQRIAGLVAGASESADGLKTALDHEQGQGTAIEQWLKDALEGAAALLDLAQAMGVGPDETATEPALPGPENAALAAHWHVL